MENSLTIFTFKRDVPKQIIDHHVSYCGSCCDFLKNKFADQIKRITICELCLGLRIKVCNITLCYDKTCPKNIFADVANSNGSILTEINALRSNCANLPSFIKNMLHAINLSARVVNGLVEHLVLLEPDEKVYKMKFREDSKLLHDSNSAPSYSLLELENPTETKQDVSENLSEKDSEDPTEEKITDEEKEIKRIASIQLGSAFVKLMEIVKRNEVNSYSSFMNDFWNIFHNSKKTAHIRSLEFLTNVKKLISNIQQYEWDFTSLNHLIYKKYSTLLIGLSNIQSYMEKLRTEIDYATEYKIIREQIDKVKHEVYAKESKVKNKHTAAILSKDKALKYSYSLYDYYMSEYQKQSKDLASYLETQIDDFTVDEKIFRLYKIIVCYIVIIDLHGEFEKELYNYYYKLNVKVNIREADGLFLGTSYDRNTDTVKLFYSGDCVNEINKYL
jgi:hypothetical protein